MARFCAFVSVIPALTVLLLLGSVRTQSTPVRAISESRYTMAHSLGDGYQFDPRDGWEVVNTTDLPYKYHNENAGKLSNDSANLKRRGMLEGALGKIEEFLGCIGVGKPRKAIITWYTGHDLENPSCWAHGNWAPTDKSFACAVTKEGWNDRPQCFKFLELCNGPKKCIFVRVVDTCAGCQKGSRHIDLTRAAFGALAEYDEGMCTIQYRPATNPKKWHTELWGPK